MLQFQENDKIANCIIKLQVKVVMNWFKCKCADKAYSWHVLNSTWSAEYAEFASIVIELVIGYFTIPCKQLHTFC